MFYTRRFGCMMRKRGLIDQFEPNDAGIPLVQSFLTSLTVLCSRPSKDLLQKFIAMRNVQLPPLFPAGQLRGIAFCKDGLDAGEKFLHGRRRRAIVMPGETLPSETMDLLNRFTALRPIRQTDGKPGGRPQRRAPGSVHRPAAGPKRHHTTGTEHSSGTSGEYR